MVTSVANETTCACCQGPIVAGEEALACTNCDNIFHKACWEAHPACVTEGCTGTAVSLEELLETRPWDKAPSTLWEKHWGWIVAGIVAIVLVLTATIALLMGVPLNTVLVISVVIAALAFDYVNGMHDAGNAIATVISTRVLTPMAALVMAAVLNLAGALFFTGVAKNIAGKFANMDQVHELHLVITPLMILCGLLGASAWSYLTASWGLPVSTSHSLFGGLIGVFLLGGIPLNMHYLQEFGLWMVLAPVLAFSVGWLLMVGLMWLFRRQPPHRVNKHFRVLQIISSASVAFSHGVNDAQKAMGIITLALVTGHFITVAKGEDPNVPLWVKIACALVIAVGTGLGGMRVIKTLGHKIIKLDPVHGFAAETVAAGVIQLVSHLHIPISTTHVISSSILGIGASKRLSAVRWGVATNIVIAWIFTIPTCALAGALLYAVVRAVTHLK